MMAAALAPERIRRLILVAPANPWSAHGKRWAPFLASAPVSWLILHLGPGLEVAHDLMLRRLYCDRSRIRPGRSLVTPRRYALPEHSSIGSM